MGDMLFIICSVFVFFSFFSSSLERNNMAVFLDVNYLRHCF